MTLHVAVRDFQLGHARLERSVLRRRDVKGQSWSDLYGLVRGENR